MALTGSVTFDKDLYSAPDRDEYVGSIAAIDAEEADEQEQNLARLVGVSWHVQLLRDRVVY